MALPNLNLAPAPRIDPASARLPFRAGEGPFQANGQVFLAALKYVKRHTPGGVPALRAALDEDDRRFIEDLFVPARTYDVAPLVRLTLAAATLEGTRPETFAKKRGRESAEMDIRGIYRLLLRVSSPQTMGERLPRAFNRYFTPCRAELVAIDRHQLRCTFTSIPLPLAGWYENATEGFVERALEMAGARDLRFTWSPPHPRGTLSSVPTASIDLEIRWSF